MSTKAFWTGKRLEAVSRTLLTLFQAFLIAGTLGGLFGKIPSIGLKALFIFGSSAITAIPAEFP